LCRRRRRQPGHASIDVDSDQLAAGGFGLRNAVSNDTRDGSRGLGAQLSRRKGLPKWLAAWTPGRVVKDGSLRVSG
jgi:hypothetical protein